MAIKILAGLGITFFLTIVCFITASLIGILTCAGFCSKNKIIRTIAKVYNGIVINKIRNRRYKTDDLLCKIVSRICL